MWQLKGRNWWRKEWTEKNKSSQKLENVRATRAHFETRCKREATGCLVAIWSPAGARLGPIFGEQITKNGVINCWRATNDDDTRTREEEKEEDALGTNTQNNAPSSNLGNQMQSTHSVQDKFADWAMQTHALWLFLIKLACIESILKLNWLINVRNWGQISSADSSTFPQDESQAQNQLDQLSPEKTIIFPYNLDKQNIWSTKTRHSETTAIKWMESHSTTFNPVAIVVYPHTHNWNKINAG